MNTKPQSMSRIINRLSLKHIYKFFGHNLALAWCGYCAFHFLQTIRLFLNVSKITNSREIELK